MSRGWAAGLRDSAGVRRLIRAYQADVNIVPETLASVHFHYYAKIVQ